jgi:uncharacterized protein (DUF1697 family)
MATGTQYLALLRGINVGGKNLVNMAELREAFEGMGFDDVATYINSGNVLFRAPRQKADDLAARIEAELSRRFGIELKIVLVTQAQLEKVVDDAPPGFGDPAYRCDVIFVRKPLTVKKAFSVVELKEGVDQAWPGKGVFYFSRLDAKASSSRLSKFAGLPEYKNTTIRSWSTTKKLAALMATR